MTATTNRSALEMALRHLAGHPDQKVSAIAKRFAVEPKELWDWLGAHNRGKKDLPVRLIDGAFISAPSEVVGFGSGHRIEIALAKGAKKSETPAAAGPGDDVAAWLKSQGLTPTIVPTYRVTISPEVAAAWLQFNLGNRKPSSAKIRRFTETAKSSNWLLNGETVKFSSSGRLMDGQSRLRAFAAAGVPVTIEVRGGLADSTQQTMDCGETRRGTHALEMLGEKFPQVLSPALRLIFQWENGSLNGGASSGRRSVLENSALKEMLVRHVGIRFSVAWAVQLGTRITKFMPASEAAFFHYLFGRAGTIARDAFFDGLRNANAMSQPVALLRQRLIAPADGARLHSRVRIKITIKAWNAHVQKRRLTALTLAPRESVAAIHGCKP